MVHFLQFTIYSPLEFQPRQQNCICWKLCWWWFMYYFQLFLLIDQFSAVYRTIDDVLLTVVVVPTHSRISTNFYNTISTIQSKLFIAMANNLRHGNWTYLLHFWFVWPWHGNGTLISACVWPYLPNIHHLWLWIWSFGLKQFQNSKYLVVPWIYHQVSGWGGTLVKTLIDMKFYNITIFYNIC